MKEGHAIIFKPGNGSKPWRKGVYKQHVEGHPGTVLVRLDGDPFDVCVREEQVKPTGKHRERTTNMPKTATKPKAKDLRRQAKALGIEGWEEMDLDEMAEAIAAAEAEQETPKKSAKKGKGKAKAAPEPDEDEDDDSDDDDEDEDESDEDDDTDEDDEDEDEDEDERPAKKSKSKAKAKPAAKSKSKKAAKPTKKAASKKDTKAKGKAKGKAKSDDDEVNENGNPYTKGTNLYWMAEALIKGGKVDKLVSGLMKKITINPRTREYDEDELRAEMHRRLIIVSQRLRNDYGFTMEKEGRGGEATIKCYPAE